MKAIALEITSSSQRLSLYQQYIVMSGIFASDNIPIEIDANDRDTHPDVPPSDRSAYEYSLDCSFQALHSPDIGLLVEMLQKHYDYMGFRDKICLLSDKCKDLLASSAF